MLKRFLALLLLLTGVLVIQAQNTIEPLSSPPEDADIAISFPPSVYVISGLTEIRGTADLVDLEKYFVEYRQLVEEIDVATERPWFPATLPRNEATRNGELGVWNTTTVRDGLYELRLVVESNSGIIQIYRVSPIRVLNNPTRDFVNIPARPTLFPTPTQLGGGGAILPSPFPTSTAFVSNDPFVTAVTDANVRTGDSTSYPQVGALLAGQSAQILGISGTGSGWFYIQLPNGRRGFIASSIVRTTGNISGLARYNPPATPTPPATATPITTANLQITGLRLDPVQPRCGEGFDIYINVANTGSGATNSSGILTVSDRHPRTSSTTGSTEGGFPVLQPGANFVVVTALTTNAYFNEEHRIVVQLDTRNQVFETNEGDNFSSLTYTLHQGGCG